MEKIYELIIIGSGPAGLTASIYASRAELDTLVIERNMISGGQIINTYEVDNYPGLPGINGFDLAIKLREHSDKLGASYVTGEVTGLSVEEDIKVITLDNQEVYKAKTIIIASGADYRKLGVPGEEKFAGMGVSYCATCDGAFYRNKITAVIGGGDVAVEDAIFLSRICKKVYVIHRRDSFRAAKSLSNRLLEQKNVEVIWNHVVDEIMGEDRVAGLRISEIESMVKREIEVNGVFIAVGNIPNTEIYQDIVKTNASGYIIAEESGTTDVEGIFVAGDIRTKNLRQIVTAASDGANAVTAVERYLNEH